MTLLSRHFSKFFLKQEIGLVPDTQTCQSFCRNLYNGTCTWFMFDRTTSDCKLFSGSLDDLYADCKGVGYSREPDYNKCNVIFTPDSENRCYVSVKLLSFRDFDTKADMNY